MDVSSAVRFRWSQDALASDHRPRASWAVDSVYIGMQCEAHCGGHGTCVSGVMCLCDDGYTGDHCTSAAPRPNFIKEDFEGQLDFTSCFVELCLQFLFCQKLTHLIQKAVSK